MELGFLFSRFLDHGIPLFEGLNRTTKRADEPLTFTRTDAGSYRIASCFGRFGVWSRMCALIFAPIPLSSFQHDLKLARKSCWFGLGFQRTKSVRSVVSASVGASEIGLTNGFRR